MPAPIDPLARLRGHDFRAHRAKELTEGTSTPRASLTPAPPVDGVATLRIYDVIDSWGGAWGISANEVAAALDALGDVAEIQVRLNSPGGEVFEGIAIMNLLRSHPAKITAVVDGLAASAASVLAASADDTTMGPNSLLMIHDAWGLGIGNAADLRDLADLLDRLSNNIADVYAAKAGGDLETWRGAMLAETWYTADEAVEAGLADRVAGAEPAEDTEAAAAAKYNLAEHGFKYAGRAQAPAPTTPAPDPKGDSAARARYAHRRHRMNARRFDVA